MGVQTFEVTIDKTFPLVCLYAPQVYLMKLGEPTVCVQLIVLLSLPNNRGENRNCDVFIKRHLESTFPWICYIRGGRHKTKDCIVLLLVIRKCVLAVKVRENRHFDEACFAWKTLGSQLRFCCFNRWFCEGFSCKVYVVSSL